MQELLTLSKIRCRRRRHLSWRRSRQGRHRSGSKVGFRQTFRATQSPFHIRSGENPAFDCLKVRNRRLCKGNVGIRTIVSVRAKFFMRGEWETESLARRELRAVVNVVRNKHHAKEGIFRRNTRHSSRRRRRTTHFSRWFADGEEVSVILAAFLAASLAASGETHVLGGDE